MNILFDAKCMNGYFAGMAKSTYYLYYHCHRLNDGFHAYGFNSENETEYKDAGITLIGRKSKGELHAFAKEKGIGVVHYPFNFLHWPVLPGFRTVLTLHDLIPYEEEHYYSCWLKKLRFILRTRYALAKADLVTTVSEYSKNSIKAFSKGKVSPEVLYWGVTLPQEYRCENRLDHPYFLYVGGYDRRKGIDKLVGAFMEMKQRGLTDSRLVLAGTPGSLDEETDSLIRMGVDAGFIVQTGYVPDEELCSLYANAICSVYLSKMEGFGLPVVEAMNFGCPVITAANTSLPEIGGNAACYVDRENREELIQMLCKMEQEPLFRENLIREGKINTARFDWDVSAGRFLNMLQSLGDV